MLSRCSLAKARYDSAHRRQQAGAKLEEAVPMDQALSEWESFYVIVGSASAVIIGLQFVVIALVGGMRRPAGPDAVSAYATPNVMHLAFALFVSAIMSAPWSSLVPTSVVLVLCGLSGLAYGAIVINRMRSHTDYSPVWEDWLWHSVLPGGAYAALALAALFLTGSTQAATFGIAAATLGLLFIGLHNAWDSVTYIVSTSSHGDSAKVE